MTDDDRVVPSTITKATGLQTILDYYVWRLERKLAEADLILDHVEITFTPAGLPALPRFLGIFEARGVPIRYPERPTRSFGVIPRPVVEIRGWSADRGHWHAYLLPASGFTALNV